ncbi:MAG TPA: hypothetical protein VMD97_10710 [Candidatus Aquilonibacter sp.]|nr:hypothetical protein [Candidatus Aquilonibacter sp.]
MNAQQITSQHLTDEQFASLVAGGRRDEDACQHVEGCEICRRELDAVGVAVNDLSSFSLRWAEQRAARIQAPSLWALNWKTLPGWGATMAAVLIFGVALGTHIETSNQTVAVQTTHTMAAPTADELAQDNRLMRSIDDEINEQPGVQMAVSALDDGSSRTVRHHSLHEVSN